MFTQKLKDTIVVTEEGVHQAILDVAFDKWQSNKEWGLVDMIDNAAVEFGRMARFAVQVGKYNQQVTNGGHAQYHDNGYASTGGGCFGNKDSFELHHQMIEDMEFFKIAKHTVNGANVLNIMKEMLKCGPGECHTCEGQGGWDGEDEEDENGDITEGEWEDCYECNGSGENDDELGYSGGLDTAYYAVYEAFMDELEAFFVVELAKDPELEQAA